MPIETKTEVLQSRIYQTSNCKHCGRKVERTGHEQKGYGIRWGSWYHAQDESHRYSLRECDDTGVEPPAEITGVLCVNCHKPIRYQTPLELNEDPWVHVGSGSWYCNANNAEPEE